MKYYAAFEESGYHTAFLTTFTFGAQAFEDMVLQRLRNSGCNNIHVFADQNMVNQEFSIMDPAKYAGTAYHLVKCKRKGAFHPKIVLQLGAKKARLLIGSANLTAPGLAGNLELVSEIKCFGADDPSAKLIAEALNYIRMIAPEPDEWFTKSIQKALQKTPWLDLSIADSVYVDLEFGTTAILHDKKNAPPLDQFIDLIGEEPIKRINIISPYWDKQLAALSRLSSAFEYPTLRIAIQKDRGLFPKDKASELANIRLFDLDEYSGSRRVHSKIIIAEGKRNDHILSGSMNCSWSALMTSAVNSFNAEAGLYRRFPTGTSIKRLGLKRCFKHAIEIEELPDYSDSVSDCSVTDSFVDGGALIVRGKQISWRPSNIHSEEIVEVELFSIGANANCIRVTLIKNEAVEIWTGTISPDFHDVLYGSIIFEGGTRSSPVHICNLNILPLKAQPKANKKVQNKLAELDSFESEDLQIIEILIQLEQLEEESISRKPKHRGTRNKSAMENNTRNYKPLTYQEFIAGRVESKKHPPSISDTLFAHKYVANVSRTLNRILGILTPTHTLAPEDDEVDLRPTERESEGDIGSDDFASSDETIVQEIPAENRIKPDHCTAVRISEAAEKLCASISDSGNSAPSLVRLIHVRAMLQVILAFSIPVSLKRRSGQVLPPSPSMIGKGWPFLIGRILSSFYRNNRDPMRDLILPDETISLPVEIIDFLAIIDVALELAKTAASNFDESKFIANRMEELSKTLRAQKERDLRNFPDANARFDEMRTGAFNRYSHLLA